MDRNYVKSVFQELHEIPEPSLAEYKTADYCAAQLESFGLDVTRNVNDSTGIIAILDSGKPGKNVGLRADMDALVFSIDGETDYRHACGHDSHMAMVLAVAKELAEKGIASGKITFIFQPAEEVMAGALLMSKSGLLDDLDEILGIHIRPTQDIPYGKAIAALRHGAAGPTNIKVKGQGAHASRPHLGVNAVESAVNIVNLMNAIKLNPTVPHSIKCTRFNSSGGADNIIPDEVALYFDTRCADNETMEELIEKMKLAIEQGAAASQADVEYTIEVIPGASFDEAIVDSAEEAIAEVLGEENTIRDFVNPGSDDFHFYTQELNIPAGFIGLGADASPGLHDVNMTFNHDAMHHGVDILLNLLEKRLIKA